MFDLTLKQINTNTIKGYHCAVFQNGSKVDCMPTDKEYSVNLTKENTNSYQGTIFSTYGATKITYKLTYNPSNDTISLERVQNPDADVFLPKEVKLSRD